MKKDLISVIFPIFGKFDVKRLYLSIESVKMQNYPNLEIVVSEQNIRPSYSAIAKKQKIKYIYKKGTPNSYNLGYVRNIGIKYARGKYLYSSDSDIVFMNENYLNEIYTFMIKKRPSYLLFPPMKHLVSSQFEHFFKNYKACGLKETLRTLSFPDGFTTHNDKKDKMKIIKYGYGRKQYTVLASEYKKISPSNLKKYGYGLLNFTYHPSGMFMEKEKLIRVGGFCEDFIGWGYDDVDLQIKLSDKFKKRRLMIPKIKKFNVLHLDHQKNFNVEKYLANQKIFNERRKLSLINLIKKDKAKNYL